MSRLESTPPRLDAAGEGRTPLVSALNPLLVHLRLPREDAASNDGKPAEKANAKGAKRDRHAPTDSSENDEEADGGVSDASSSAGKPTPAGKKKKRKPTYAVRKAEKEDLVKELQVLEARAGLLCERIGMPRREEHETLQKAQDLKTVMEEARRTQREQFCSPLKTYIRLGKDMAQRRASLLELRAKKLDVAYRLMNERFQGVDDREPFSEDQSWTSSEGHFCFHRADVLHFAGAQSVKQVFDALMFFFTNMEISIYEVLGQLTLREDIDSVDTRISNHRIISTSNLGIMIEVNALTFGEYYDCFKDRGGEEFALFTSDTVDEDELYPYCPSERVQKDIVAAVTISSFRRPVKTFPSAIGGMPRDELVVVVRRCAYLRVQRPAFEVSAEALEDLRANVASWGLAMTKTMKDHIFASNGVTLAL